MSRVATADTKLGLPRLLMNGLVVAAVMDWLLARTISRAAIFMPKTPLIISVYEGLTFAGQVAATLTSLLAVLAVGWLSWRLKREGHSPLVSLSLVALIPSALLFTVIPSGSWTNFARQGLLIGALLLLWSNVSRGLSKRLRLAWIIPLVGLIGGGLYHQLSALSAEGIQLPLSSLVFYRIAEGAALTGAFSLWWVYGRPRMSPRVALVASVPALLFMIGYLLQPATTAALAIWSTGFPMNLPWYFYISALWAAAATVLVTRCPLPQVSTGILLLLAGGLAPQWSTYALLGLITIGVIAEDPPVEVGIQDNRESSGSVFRLTPEGFAGLLRSLGRGNVRG